MSSNTYESSSIPLDLRKSLVLFCIISDIGCFPVANQVCLLFRASVSRYAGLSSVFPETSESIKPALLPTLTRESHSYDVKKFGNRMR
ncbi:hypothetical protein FR483_n419L [Paramecium bursaria Chlorella virus FR483]|uniref:Uncharacterized protein n419L n=1 Tax=Paramecium bursaria Chlorella virus FR483 TaxID=399781 RepID=A7J7C3_PBCVF|nr:hypothetical protein FR483_n419L [Paramecium bursaria Chlorella virus FR483]ABT15704.1 hypothetical protein FR483_n419L [Paramecium bursaria Chlorella virus FR483]